MPPAPEVRTRAMAMIGASIGLSFALSLVLAPVMVGWAGLSGLFWLIAALGTAALLIAAFVVPTAPMAPKPAVPIKTTKVLGHRGLLRLNFGVFCLHLTQVALFVVIPPLLVSLGGLTANTLWYAYLPVLFVSFLFMVPIIFVTEKRRAHAHTLRLAVLGLVLVGVGFALSTQHWWALLACLTAFLSCLTCSRPSNPHWCQESHRPSSKAWRSGSTTPAKPWVFSWVAPSAVGCCKQRAQ